jgi:hypothetical protein
MGRREYGENHNHCIASVKWVFPTSFTDFMPLDGKNIGALVEPT